MGRLKSAAREQVATTSAEGTRLYAFHKQASEASLAGPTQLFIFSSVLTLKKGACESVCDWNQTGDLIVEK